MLLASAAVGVVVLLLGVSLALRVKEGPTTVAESPLVGNPAPELAGETIDGTTYRLDEAPGRWVLVNFFATWCVPCIEEHDDLVRFATRHATLGDAGVVGVIYNDHVNAVRDFRDENGGAWPMLVDPDGQLAVRFGVRGVPESFLIAPDGTVVSKVVGGIRDDELEALLSQASGPARGR